MKPLCARLALALMLSSLTTNVTPAAAPDWFPRAEMMTIGAYYYPEAWPENQWARDMANMRKMGMEFVHMGDFAWAFMEPEEGKYQFDWLEKNVALAAQNGLKVILCTPTAAPPVWLARKHPEALMVDATGRRMNHGGRTQGDWSSPVFRDYAAKITTELAKRFGNDKRVWGWQLDNELSHYEKQYSYSQGATLSFRGWLRAKYVTIDKLNADWGTAFWSMVYQNFDQIEIPNQLEHPALPNPHAQLDFSRWFAEDAADYLRMQAGLLRKVYAGAGAAPATLKADFLVDWRDGFWVATNFTSTPQTIPARAGVPLLVGARSVPPGGVAVWVE